MPLYFAHGSNLDERAMATRCPGARPLGLARLRGHRPAIMREGYLTVLRDPRCEVPGLLWDLPLSDIGALDRYEGVSSGLYVKAHLAVATSSGTRRALVYLGTNAGPGLPAEGYLEAVLSAARRLGLPDDHCRKLAALAPRRPPAVEAKPKVRPTRATPFDTEPSARHGGWSP